MSDRTEMADGARDTYLTGRHAIVTGAGRGIGAAIATALARLGARVTVLARGADAVAREAERLSTTFGVQTFGVACDVTDAEAVRIAFTDAQDRLGPPYILVNNAGQSDSAPFLETTPELLSRMLAVNLVGPFHCTQQVLPAMLGAREGRIITIASTAGLKGYARVSAYGASKHGVVGLTRALAVETAKSGITVNAVCPGYTDTAMAQQAIDSLVRNRGVSEAEARTMLLRGIPRGVLTRPEEVANAVAWLCSPDAGAITGQAIAVAGGEVM